MLKDTLNVLYSSSQLLSSLSIQNQLRYIVQCAWQQLRSQVFITVASCPEPIPFILQRKEKQLKYRSAIAAALARKRLDLSPVLAKQLTECLKSQIVPDFAQIEYIPPDGIEFTLGETAIQQWLYRSLSDLSVSNICSEKIVSFPDYVRDRCGQLLQLCIEENMISSDLTQWKDVSFMKLTILECQDWELLYQLISIGDRFEKVSTRPQQKQKLAYHLSQAFMSFHQQIPLFNRQHPNFPNLSILRLALILLTQEMLENLID